MKHIISLGAGVQSSTMAIMAAAGEITPMPDCAIFSDTQAEPLAVYEWLAWLEKQLPFPVYRVTAGSLFSIIGQPREKGRYAHMPLPAFVRGSDGKPSLLNRSCTRDFKIRPIRRKLKQLLGIERRRAPPEAVVTQWMGISTDESQRAKPSGESWIEHRWPLLERGFSRENCLRWMGEHGYPRPPRSSCTFCPYHNDGEWLDIQRDPVSWAQAVEIDDRIRTLRAEQRVSQEVYLHRNLRPLKELVFKIVECSPDLFDEKTFAIECEGMCGV